MYRRNDSITKRLYMPRHVTFFECVPYFALPLTTTWVQSVVAQSAGAGGT